MKLSAKLSKGLENLPLFNRPLAFLCAAFLVGLFCFVLNLISFIIYAAVLVLYSVCLICTRGARFKGNPLPYLLIAVLIISAVLPLPSLLNYKKLSSLSGEHTVTAVIEETYYEQSFGALYVARITHIDGQRTSGRVELEYTDVVELELYDTVTVKGEISNARENLSSSELYNAISKDIYVNVLVSDTVSVTNDAKAGIKYTFSLVRNALRNRLYSLLDFDTASYASALILGDKSGIPTDLKTAMSALGISHILAVSGMHLSIISMLISFLAEKTKQARKLKCALIIIGAVCFMGIADFSASVVRAAIMLIISIISIFSGRRNDSLTSLLLSGAILCAINPSSILSCSFLLSFFATLGIVLCALFAERSARISLYASRVGDMKLAYRITRKIVLSLLVTLCATLFTVPVMSLYFSSASFFSVLTNPLAVTMAFVSVLLTVLCLIFGGIPYAGVSLCAFFEFLYKIFYRLAIAISQGFDTAVSLRHPFFVPVMILLCCTLLFLAIRKVRNPLSVIAAFTVCAIIYFSAVQIYGAINKDRAQLIYSATPNTESFTVISGEDTLYIDVGNGSRRVTDEMLEEVKNEYYEVAIDGYMLTHYHSLHIGTVSKLLSSTKIKALYLPLPETEKEQNIYTQIKDIARQYKIIEYKRGDAFKFGEVEIKTTSYSLLERSEHPVICMQFSSNGKSITYLGSSVSESNINVSAEQFISQSGAIICGRHGPITKEDNKFISYTDEKSVYLSPFEDTNEQTAFENGKFYYLEEGYKSAVFSLA